MSKILLSVVIIAILGFLANNLEAIRPIFELIGTLFRFFVAVLMGLIQMLIAIFEALL